MPVTISFLALVNLVVFSWTLVTWTLVGRVRPPQLANYAWVFVVLAAFAISHFKGRGNEPRAALIRMSLLSVFALPLCLLLLWNLFVGALFIPLEALYSLTKGFFRPPEYLLSLLLLPGISAYYALPSLRGVTYVSTTVALLVFALRNRTFSYHRWTFSLLAGVTFFYAGHLVWWFLTGQKFGFL